MKFGDIFPLLLVLLILYYAAIIAMDLYKSKLEKEAEKEKNTEEDIDISDEAATFQPIRIRRDEPQNTVSASTEESPVDKKDDVGVTPNGDKPTEGQKKDSTMQPETEVKAEPEPETPPENKAVVDSKKVKDNEKPDGFDPRSWKIPENIIRQHNEQKTGVASMQSHPAKPSAIHSEITDKIRRNRQGVDSELSESSGTVSTPMLHEPIMDGGLLVEDLYELASNAAENGNADLQNIVMKCESD